MAGNFSFDQLKKAVSNGEIDTVLACIVDMQGRLAGKRFLAQYFVDSAHGETHGCNYLLACDIDMEPVPGYKAASWSKGYGDFVMKPDLATLRRLPWLEKTALVICDVLDHHDHEDLAHSPRAILKKQVKRLKDRGYIGYFASELEFYLFNETYDSARKKHWQGLDSASPYIGDYQIGITTKEEGVMRRLRNEMEAAGIPIENSKGEWGPGQEEINVRYAEALDMADRHVILKNGAKEIADSEGKSISFMAKYNYGLAGNSSHIHNSLWSADGKTPLFFDKSAEWTLSTLGQHWAAGQIKYAKEFTWFLAPYINSYKRFQAGTFAPTKIMWSEDNRTAGFRLCGEGTKGIRMECRIGGADLNPYLAFAALIASGLAGIDEKLELQKPFVGDAYQASRLPEIPKTLRDATETLSKSKMLKQAFGEDVVEHYVHTARWEQFEYDRRITDWELHRGFERY
ncbi:MAG: glutamine synthetase [Mesorhizobium sp.]|uniref:glutamine synthetase family protein n=1 Tax=unclassified Mesorhizobium TaxID=325217 RepID=UPI000F75BBAE|nr:MULTISPECIES: glutamine synthetase family protein [unclassified Mesorhizobium]AZO51067.1 glutamine synthetase [Mesorhizobium sp. M4B.F.Ca.ET.058.02.1.1]RVC45822.1 glutamine synthetase [Mesorhizobium sp. M4A.F.Ca.ET.090.04.2.1]RWC58105.1 MAG: glutamine synthetase [Mesorhizobium sp.]RWD07800.1 MAG: glutamine synthetase [Mesorhizobium sp.]RWD18065.1 MAG: glutamine synthetase [Mesorhizobium sp.]